MEMNRRDFLKLVTAVAGEAIIGGCRKQEFIMPGETGKMRKNVLGKTNLEVSMIGCGGIMFMSQPPELARRVVPEAIDQGVNYFDVAPSYGDAELKLGPALKPYRDKVYLACKTTARDKAGAAREIENSLKRLETDHFDVYQLHAITDVEKDVKAALGKNGAMEAILEAKKQGIIRNIGFSAHSPQAALAAIREFDFDTMMYPINFCTHFKEEFEVDPLAQAKKRNMGIICIKSLATQRWPEGSPERDQFPNCWYQPITDPQIARIALSWSLEQGPDIILSPGSDRLLKMAVDLAPALKPLTPEESNQLKALCAKYTPIFEKTA
jgi:aryl-alcohol dehydrogenase-like predicted oxidoreductase